MNKQNNQSKTVRLFATLLLCVLVIATSVYLPVHGENEIYDTVIRLHVLANSDSTEDQALKLTVRDALLKDSAEALSLAKNRKEAKQNIVDLLPHLQEVAENALRDADSSLPVRITLTEEYYPTKEYGNFRFPSGTYLSLRVMIGEATGQNWWCVLFPPMCLSAATISKQQAEEELLAVGLSRDQYSIITETQDQKYKLRFKFLEIIEDLIDS